MRDLVGKNEGMFVPWSENVQIKVMRSTEFCIEVHITTDNERKILGNFLCMLVQMQMKENDSGKS